MSMTKRPRDVKNTRDFIKMESDNFGRSQSSWSILHNGRNVSLHYPGGGAWVNIPVEDFNAIVDWYMAEQPIAIRGDAT